MESGSSWKALKEILPYVDYCSAGELDARYLLEIPEDRMNSGFVYYYQQMQQQFPNIKCFYSTKGSFLRLATISW